MLIVCSVLFAIGTIFIPNTMFFNILFPLGMFALPRYFEVQRRLKLQKELGKNMLELKTNPKDEKINRLIINFARQSKEDSFLMILLMYASVLEVFAAKNIILKAVALALAVVMIKFNYDRTCVQVSTYAIKGFRRPYKIYNAIKMIDIVSFVMISLIGFILFVKVKSSNINDIVIGILSISSFFIGYLNRNKCIAPLFSTVKKEGFDTATFNYQYVSTPMKIISKEELEELEKKKRKNSNTTIRITLDADARARQSKKEKQVYQNYQLFLYNGRKNREKNREEHRGWVSRQYMTDEERAEYEAKKKREQGNKDSGYVEVEKDDQTVDRFSNKGRR